MNNIKTYKVKDLPNGLVLWDGYKIIGITGVNIPMKYNEYECYQEAGNPIDFSIIKPKKEVKE